MLMLSLFNMKQNYDQLKQQLDFVPTHLLEVLEEFQFEGIERIFKDNLILADRCGFGKTAQFTIGARLIQKLKFNYQRPNLILIFPKVNQAHIIAEIKKWTGGKGWFFRRKHSDIIHSVLKHHPDLFLVTNYDTLRHRQTLEILQQIEFATIIADEAHSICNHKAKRTIAVKKLSTHRKVASSYTIVERGAADYFSILHWFNRKKFGSQLRFVEKYSNIQKSYRPAVNRKGESFLQEIKEILGFRNKTQFEKEISKPYVLQRDERNVKGYKKPRKVDIKIEMTDKQKKVHDRILKSDMLVEFPAEEFEFIFDPKLSREMIIQNGLAKVIRLLQISSNPKLLGFDIPSAKEEWLWGFIENNSKQQILVLTAFNVNAKYLYNKTKKQYPEKRVAIISGGLNTFVYNENYDVIICTVQSATSYDFWFIQQAIFYDSIFYQRSMTQASLRIDRLRGDRSQRKVIYYLKDNSFGSFLVFKALKEKLSVKEIIDNLNTKEGYYG